MQLKYTGRADTLQLGNKVYAKSDLYKKNPSAYDGSYDKPIEIDEDVALKMSERSNMHSWETVRGKDLMDTATLPEQPLNPSDPIETKGK